MKKDTIKHHYVYTIIEKDTGKKYIGVRSSNVLPNEDLGKNYFSSSTNEYFISNQKNNPNNYEYIINSIHKNRKEANEKEIELHEFYNVSNSNEFYNKSKSTSSGFSTVGNVTAKDKEGNTMLLNKNDERYLSGEFVHMSTGKVSVKDKNGNKMSVDNNDDRLKSGELVGVNKGKVVILDENGKYKQVDKSSIDMSKPIKNTTYGKVSVKDKDGNKMLVDNNDERYLSGELVGVNKGKVLAKDKNGNKMMVDKNDPRYISGELVFHLKGNKVNDEVKKQQSINRTGKITKLTKKVSINGTIYLSIKLASENLDITTGIISRRCNSKDLKWIDWYFINN